MLGYVGVGGGVFARPQKAQAWPGLILLHLAWFGPISCGIGLSIGIFVGIFVVKSQG